MASDGLTLGDALVLTLIGGCVVGGICHAVSQANLANAITKKLENENPAAAAAIEAWNKDLAKRAAALSG